MASEEGHFAELWAKEQTPVLMLSQAASRVPRAVKEVVPFFRLPALP